MRLAIYYNIFYFIIKINQVLFHFLKNQLNHIYSLRQHRGYLKYIQYYILNIDKYLIKEYMFIFFKKNKTPRCIFSLSRAVTYIDGDSNRKISYKYI